MLEKIEKGLIDSARVKLSMVESGFAPEISMLVQACIDTIVDGGKLMIAGNGGSAADAQHIAAELVGRYLKDRKALPAIALTTDTSAITSIANDAGYDQIFARQVEGLGAKGDLFLAISTSGNSGNLIKAIEKCGEMGIKTACLLGGDGGAMKKMAEHAVVVPSNSVPRIQESHITIGHLLCELIEDSMEGLV